MENSKPLATESFSYSWLTDKNPSSSDNLRSILTENSSQKDQNFNFDVPAITASAASLVHADEIFFDGQIKPAIYIDRSSSSKVEALKSSTSVPVSPISSRSIPFLVNKNQYFIKKWRKSSKRILQKCFGFVKPLYQTLGCSRKNIRVDDLDRKVCEIQSWSNSLEASPRHSSTSAYSVLDWDEYFNKLDKKVDVCYELKKVKSGSSLPVQMSPFHSSYSNEWCEVESSIHEAILYCKRSIEK